MRDASRAFGVFSYAAPASALATLSLPLASATQMSLALPDIDEQASLSVLYCESACFIAIAWSSFDIDVGEIFSGVLCAAAIPDTPSPAAMNSAIISLDMPFPFHSNNVAEARSQA